jgi:hypothetical protein
VGLCMLWELTFGGGGACSELEKNQSCWLQVTRNMWVKGKIETPGTL